MNLNPVDELKEEQELVIFNPVRSLKCMCMMYLLQYAPNDQLTNVCGDALYEERRSGEKPCTEPVIQTSDELTYAVEKYEQNIKLSDVYDVGLYERRARIEDNKSCLVPEAHMSDEFNSALDQYKPNIQLSSVCSDALYEGRLRIDVDKSCSEPKAHMTSEFNPANLYDIPLIEGGVKIDFDKSCSKPEVHMIDELNSAVGQEKSVQLKQSAVKKNISNKNESSDEFKWPSSDSSDEGEKSPLDSSDEWEMNSSHSSDKSETLRSPSDDSYDSSNSLNKNEVAGKKKKNQQPEVKDLSEYEKKIQKNRDEKMAFLQSLRMNEVKEDLNEAITKLKPKQPQKKVVVWPKHPVRKSVRLKKRNFDFSEQTLQRKAFYGIEEEIQHPVRKSARLKRMRFDFSEETLQRKAFYGIEKEIKEGRLRIDVGKSCSEPKAHMTSEFNPANVYDIPLIEGGVKIDIDKSRSKLEVQTSDELNSTVEQEVKELSEYEKKIQKNRDEKIAFLQSLRMNEVKEDLHEAIMNLKPPEMPRKKVVCWPKHPVRKSIRLNEVHFDYSERTLQRKAYDVGRKIFKCKKKKKSKRDKSKCKKKEKSKSDKSKMKRKSKHDKSKPVSKTVYKHTSHTSETILSFLLQTPPSQCSKKFPPILTFEKAITGCHIYADFIRDYDDLDYIEPRPFTDYVSCFSKMKTGPSKIVKISDFGITALAFHPMKEKIILSAGNKDGAIGFWHVTAYSVPYIFKPHLLEVPCMKFFDDNLNQIISCSFDGTLRCGDLEKKVFTEVFNISEETSCNYFDFISPSATVVCHGNGNVSVVDLRSDSKSAEKSCKCHMCAVTTVSIHPANKNYFVSGDKKGFICLWDLRKFQKKPVIKVNPYWTSITSALFSPVSGNSILVSSVSDNSLCILDSSVLGISLPLYKKVWHDFEYESRRPKAVWLPNNDNALVVGSKWNPRKIQVFNNHLENIYSFKDEHLLNRTSNNIFHPSLPVLAAGCVHEKASEVYIFS